MKPNFALNISDTHIGLLHRTSKGWKSIGEVAFDSPDLEEALGYLRSSALGLSPQGITTKLILPSSQVLFTKVEAPGQDKAAREAQIREAIDGRTPYGLDELVFDWSGKGPELSVAIVARETLEVAESFADTHRFNPVSFVTMPDEAEFTGEPWFGPSTLAGKLLSDDEKVERDQDPVKILGADGSDQKDTGSKTPKDNKPSEKKKGAAEPDAEPDKGKEKAEEAPDGKKSDSKIETKGTDKAAEAKTTEAEAAAKAARDAEAKARAKAEEQARKEREAEAAAKAEADRIMRERAEADRRRAEARALEQAEEEARRAAEEARKAEEERKQETAPPALSATAPPATGTSKPLGAAIPAFSSRRRDDTARMAAAVTTPAPEPAKAPAAKPASVLEDPHRAETAKVTSPQKTATATPDTTGDVTPIAAAKSASGSSASKADDVSINGAAGPDAGAGSDKAGSDKKATPPPPRGGALGSGAPSTAPRSPARPLPPMVTAPSIPGTAAANRMRKADGPVERPVPPPPNAMRRRAKARAEAEGMEGFEKLPQGRGKPRFLGLALTGILLLVLAIVAAWSSIYLSQGEQDDALPAVAANEATTTDEAINTPAAVVPSSQEDLNTEATPDDPEALADAESAAEEAVLAALPPETPPEDPETEAATDNENTAAPVVEGTEGAAQPGSDNPPQDEIFLATTDTPPPAFDSVALPPPGSAPDAAPEAAMPPPPFGEEYEFNPDGTIRATARGVVTPGGFWLIAARPSIMPPLRPGSEAPQTETPAAAPPSDAPEETANSAIEAAISEAVAGNPAFAPDPEAASLLRPTRRPQSIDSLLRQPGDDDAAIRDEIDTRLVSLRPRQRTQAVAERGEETARREAEAASLVAATSAASAAMAEDRPNVLPVAYSLRPAERPRDFSRAVAAAVQEATQSSAGSQSRGQAAAAASPEEEPEPETRTSAAPRIPTRANVARQATYKNAINLSRINLIGVYGTKNKRYALIRSGSGRYTKVRVGDRVDGGTVAAITSSEVRYKKGGRMLSLAMPKG
ncbi:MAG: hypothetical protein ACK5M4_07400 [Pseudorhodobacter sp.]